MLSLVLTVCVQAGSEKLVLMVCVCPGNPAGLVPRSGDPRARLRAPAVGDHQRAGEQQAAGGDDPGEEGDPAVRDHDRQTRRHAGGAHRQRQDHRLQGQCFVGPGGRPPVSVSQSVNQYQSTNINQCQSIIQSVSINRYQSISISQSLSVNQSVSVSQSQSTRERLDVSFYQCGLLLSDPCSNRTTCTWSDCMTRCISWLVAFRSLQ